VATWSSGMILA